jgi:hypothetical protein
MNNSWLGANQHRTTHAQQLRAETRSPAQRSNRGHGSPATFQVSAIEACWLCSPSVLSPGSSQ